MNEPGAVDVPRQTNRRRRWLVLGVFLLVLGAAFLVWRFLVAPPLTDAERPLVGAWQSQGMWKGPETSYAVLHLGPDRQVRYVVHDRQTGRELHEGRFQQWRLDGDTLILFGPVYFDDKRYGPTRGSEAFQVERPSAAEMTLTLTGINGNTLGAQVSVRFACVSGDQP